MNIDEKDTELKSGGQQQPGGMFCLPQTSQQSGKDDPSDR